MNQETLIALFILLVIFGICAAILMPLNDRIDQETMNMLNFSQKRRNIIIRYDRFESLCLSWIIANWLQKHITGIFIHVDADWCNRQMIIAAILFFILEIIGGLYLGVLHRKDK